MRRSTQSNLYYQDFLHCATQIKNPETWILFLQKHSSLLFCPKYKPIPYASLRVHHLNLHSPIRNLPQEKNKEYSFLGNVDATNMFSRWDLSLDFLSLYFENILPQDIVFSNLFQKFLH